MAAGSMLEPPSPGSHARFSGEFGQRVLLTVDVEEEFDWSAAFSRDRHRLDHIAELTRFQSFCEEIGAHPVYMVDWPVVQDPRAVEIIGGALKRGRADLGMQLHSWVNPPFEEELSEANSFAGNLPAELEAAKFAALRTAVEDAFGTAPLIYRAGRYGLGQNTADILTSAGITLDSSVRALFDYSPENGPDFTHHPVAPYWANAERTLLELPLTSVYWGVLRELGRQIHRAQRHVPNFLGGLSRTGLLERIALTPEGVTTEEALRGIDIALDSGLPLLVLSFHSPSLAPGNTPYARTPDEVARIYDWLRAVFAYFDMRGVRSAGIADILGAVER